MRDRLTAYLCDRQLLLVLDNFEHVIQARPRLAELLASAPRLMLLVTSRVALHLAGEQRYSVPPLALPNLTHRLPSQLLAQYAALDLFVQRARSVYPRFALTDSNAPAVAEICVRLDGLPLAIELAATRISLFTPPELLARLDQRFTLLTAGMLDMPERQRTLRRAIDWSYALLDEAERTLFRRLGVFAGGCTIEAAETVCGGQGLRIEDSGWKKVDRSSILAPRFSILDRLAALVDKSLLRREEGSDGQSRFTMLETIREYALERLAEAGEVERTQEWHVVYYLALAEATEPRLATSDQLVWLDRLAQDHDNLRAALSWAVDHDPETALRLSGTLTDFWITRGYLSEGRAWLERALAGVGAPACGGAEPGQAAGPLPIASSAARAKALHGAGMVAHMQEDNLRAQALFAQSLTLARALGDPRRVALLLNDLAELALHRGDTARAMTLCAEGLALARAAHNQSAAARLLLGLGDVVKAQGDMQRTAELLAEGLTLARSVGDQENTAWLLYHTGRQELEQHKLVGAAARFGESARLLHVLGAGQGVALNLAGLAAVMIQHQDLAQAARLLSVAETQHWVASNSWWVAADRVTYEHTVAVVRAQLDEATFATAWSAGRAMSLEQAIASALSLH